MDSLMANLQSSDITLIVAAVIGFFVLIFLLRMVAKLTQTVINLGCLVVLAVIAYVVVKSFVLKTP